jgi:hypothetical protein
MGVEDRRQPRRSAYAKVLTLEERVPGYLRDVSAGGIRVALLRPVAVALGDTLRLTVLPLPEMGLEPFPLAMVVRWSRRDQMYHLLGGEISTPADPRHRRDLQQLLAYYGRG